MFNLRQYINPEVMYRLATLSPYAAISGIGCNIFKQCR